MEKSSTYSALSSACDTMFVLMMLLSIFLILSVHGDNIDIDTATEILKIMNSDVILQECIENKVNLTAEDLIKCMYSKSNRVCAIAALSMPISRYYLNMIRLGRNDTEGCAECMTLIGRDHPSIPALDIWPLIMLRRCPVDMLKKAEKELVETWLSFSVCKMVKWFTKGMAKCNSCPPENIAYTVNAMYTLLFEVPPAACEIEQFLGGTQTKGSEAPVLSVEDITAALQRITFCKNNNYFVRNPKYLDPATFGDPHIAPFVDPKFLKHVEEFNPLH